MKRLRGPRPRRLLTCLVGGGRASLGGLWVWLGGAGGGVSSRAGLATEEEVELQRERFE